MEEKMMEGGKCEGGMCMGKHGDMCEGHCGCKCMHHKMKGVFMVVIGGVVLAGGLNYLDMTSVTIVIGALIVLMGLKKIFAGMCKCC